MKMCLILIKLDIHLKLRAYSIMENFLGTSTIIQTMQIYIYNLIFYEIYNICDANLDFDLRGTNYKIYIRYQKLSMK